MPASHPGSRKPWGWVRAAHGVGGMFGGFLGASFGGLLEMIALAAALGVLSAAIVPFQKRLRSGKSKQRRIEGKDDRSQ